MDEGESRVLVVSAHFGSGGRCVVTNLPLKRAVQIFPPVFSEDKCVPVLLGWGWHVRCFQSERGSALKEGREMAVRAAIKQFGIKLGEASCSTQ